MAFQVGQRVYCPTYGGYGVITKLGEEKATITIDLWGIGSVQIKHGDYEIPKYQPTHGLVEATHKLYEAYCETVWQQGEEALTYDDWTQQQVQELENDKDGLQYALDVAICGLQDVLEASARDGDVFYEKHAYSTINTIAIVLGQESQSSMVMDAQERVENR